MNRLFGRNFTVLITLLLALTSAVLLADIAPTSEVAERIVKSRLTELKQAPTNAIKEGEKREYYRHSGELTPHPEEAAYELKYTITPASGDNQKIREVDFIIEWKPQPELNYRQKFRMKSYLEIPNQ